MRKQSNFLAYIFLLLTVTFWAGNFIVGKYASLYEVPPFSLNFYRWFFAWLILVPFTLPEIIKKKPNIRLLEIKEFSNSGSRIEMKTLQNKVLIQETDSIVLTKKDLNVVTIKKPTANQINDLLFAFKVARYVKSNSIVFAKNGRTLGIGAGQMSRIDSTNIAKTKAKNHGISLKGCVMASEAFFPFRDNVDLAKKIGVTAIIQPGGSIKDQDIIDVVNSHKMSMVLSGVRVFKH